AGHDRKTHDTRKCIDQIAQLEEAGETFHISGNKSTRPKSCRCRSDTHVEELADENDKAHGQCQSAEGGQSEDVSDECELDEIGDRDSSLPDPDVKRVMCEAAQLRTTKSTEPLPKRHHCTTGASLKLE